MGRKLIINADGFGFTKGTNSGIVESIEKGVVSSISCNVNFPHIESVQQIARNYPRVSIGLHFNVNVGRPVCPPEQVPSLLNTSGEFWGNQLTHQLITRKINLRDLERECEAQIKQLEHFGVQISHLDGHQNKHLLPGYFGIVLKLGQKFGIKRIRCHRRYIFTRVGKNRKVEVLRYYISHPRQLVTHGYNAAMMMAARRKGFQMADRMISHGYINEAEKHKLDAWVEIIRSLPDGINEIYCHPGYPDDDLRRYATYVDERALELSTLTAKELKEAIAQEKVEIVSFNDL